MYTVSISLSFEAAHRLMKHKGKCRFLHGHNWDVIVRIGTHDLDQNGMVLDFGEIKHLAKDWIAENLDHTVILNKEDPLAKVIGEYTRTGSPFLTDDDPTSEVLARILYRVFLARVQGAISNKRPLLSVEVRETNRVDATYDGL